MCGKRLKTNKAVAIIQKRIPTLRVFYSQKRVELNERRNIV